MDDYKATVEVRPVARSDEPIIVTFDLAYSQLINLVSLVILEGITVHYTGKTLRLNVLFRFPSVVPLDQEEIILIGPLGRTVYN